MDLHKPAIWLYTAPSRNVSRKGWDQGVREVPPASRNSSLGLLSALKLVVRDEFWNRMVNKFPRSLLEEFIARVRTGESWGVSLKTGSLR